ncbi:MAG: hypothetical protein ACK4N5_18215, partial [Myxococcales bacterium]
FEPHQEVLLAHLINFRFAFPDERDKVPQWVLEKLIASALGPPRAGPDGLCRGTLLSRCQYAIDLSMGAVDAREVEVPAWREHCMGETH